MQVLTPQQFRKVDDDNDIFNHSNRHFWEVCRAGTRMLRQPAYTDPHDSCSTGQTCIAWTMS